MGKKYCTRRPLCRLCDLLTSFSGDFINFRGNKLYHYNFKHASVRDDTRSNTFICLVSSLIDCSTRQTTRCRAYLAAKTSYRRQTSVPTAKLKRLSSVKSGRYTRSQTRRVKWLSLRDPKEPEDRGHTASEPHHNHVPAALRWSEPTHNHLPPRACGGRAPHICSASTPLLRLALLYHCYCANRTCHQYIPM